VLSSSNHSAAASELRARRRRSGPGSTSRAGSAVVTGRDQGPSLRMVRALAGAGAHVLVPALEP
jgi:hypothetical protein